MSRSILDDEEITMGTAITDRHFFITFPQSGNKLVMRRLSCLTLRVQKQARLHSYGLLPVLAHAYQPDLDAYKLLYPAQVFFCVHRKAIEASYT